MSDLKKIAKMLAELKRKNERIRRKDEDEKKLAEKLEKEIIELTAALAFKRKSITDAEFKIQKVDEVILVSERTLDILVTQANNAIQFIDENTNQFK